MDVRSIEFLPHSQPLSDDRSGLSAITLFKKGFSIAYDDFRLLDTEYTEIEEKDINLSIDLGKNVILQTPIIASPMDTVTNAQMCIAIANNGGIGCIHMNYKKHDNTPDISSQIEEIIKVKRHENGFIEEPLTVRSDQTMAEVVELSQKNKFGITIKTFPVVDENHIFVGLLRHQDYSSSYNLHLKVEDRMIPRSLVITADEKLSLVDAREMLWDNHLLVLPILDSKTQQLLALVSRRDVDKFEKYPLATLDENRRLRVLFAVETRPDYAYERLKRGFAAGADGVIIDTSQGYTKYEKEIVEFITKNYPNKLIIGGNISTKEAHKSLASWGIDAARIGQGAGSICTTALAIGISRASATSVYDCSNADTKMKAIADGGLKNVGDIIKAISLGASGVMLGNMLAGTDEAPGEAKYIPETGEYVKEYRGMGSKEANTMGIRGYNKLPQGVSGYVPYKGSMDKLISLYRDGIVSGMKVLNCRNVEELQRKTKEGIIRFEMNTSNSGKEMGASVKEK